MRIVDRATFMAMPAGTLFAKGKAEKDGWISQDFGEVFQKGDTLEHGPDHTPEEGGGDFTYMTLGGIDGEDPEDVSRRQCVMLGAGVSEPLATWMARDGCFDPKDVFLVYEQEDIIRLADALANALRAIAGLPLYALRHTDGEPS